MKTKPSLNSGQIRFPSTQNPNADSNTLDDYEEGTWTPVLTFAVPGDLAVAYTRQIGTYTKIGRQVTVSCDVVTSSFTHTTASGALQVTGLPFTSLNLAGSNATGAVRLGGYLAPTYTNVSSQLTNNSTILIFIGTGSGIAGAVLATTDMPTGGQVVIRTTLSYIV